MILLRISSTGDSKIMKILQACLIIAIHFWVIIAKRRRVRFMNCPSAKPNSDLIATKPARSRIECSVICLNDPHCLSATVCKTSNGYTCQLSGFYADGSCSGFVADGLCRQTAMVNPCENAGTFYPENRTCLCVEGFVGDYCQRRYRDCTETQGYTLYLVQPFGSDYIFEWKCYREFTFAAAALSWLRPSQVHTWQVLKEGIPVHPFYFFLGLESQHQLTKQGVYDMCVTMIGSEAIGTVWYRNVRVDSAENGYALHWDKVVTNSTYISNIDYLLDGFGAEGDATMSINGARFGTFDNDVNGCARANNASWWYNPLNCTMFKFGPDGFYWPTNQTGRMELQQFKSFQIGLVPVYWYIEDDLTL